MQQAAAAAQLTVRVLLALLLVDDGPTQAAAGAGACQTAWETLQTDPDAEADAQVIDFLDSGKVAAGFTIAAKLNPTPGDVTTAFRYTDMGLVSQCTCKCGTAKEVVPAHSGMLVGLKKAGGGTSVMLAFLGPGAKSESSWLLGPEVPPGKLSDVEVQFTPDAGAGAKAGTIRLSVGSQTKKFPNQPTPGGFGPYHYPWRVGWMGGGGKKCRDHSVEPPSTPPPPGFTHNNGHHSPAHARAHTHTHTHQPWDASSWPSFNLDRVSVFLFGHSLARSRKSTIVDQPATSSMARLTTLPCAPETARLAPAWHRRPAGHRSPGCYSSSQLGSLAGYMSGLVWRTECVAGGWRRPILSAAGWQRPRLAGCSGPTRIGGSGWRVPRW